MQNIFSSPVGNVVIKICDEQLVGLEYSSAIQESSDVAISPSTLSLLTEVKTQLRHYFTNPKFCFSLPLKLKGTELQKKIWQELQNIPSGKVVTYGYLAKKINTGPRIIGNACRKNPIAIIVPCHRVVGIHGLGGYGGQTAGKLFDVKKWLLNFEKNFSA